MPSPAHLSAVRIMGGRLDVHWPPASRRAGLGQLPVLNLKREGLDKVVHMLQGMMALPGDMVGALPGWMALPLYACMPGLLADEPPTGAAAAQHQWPRLHGTSGAHKKKLSTTSELAVG
jgi:hypothetical protein